MGPTVSKGKDRICALSPLINAPEDLIIEVLVRVPARDLVKHCVHVCHQWRDLIEKPTLWKIKCQQEGKYKPHVMPQPQDFKKLYFFNPFARNLIKNPCARNGVTFWTVKRGSFEIKSSAAGSQHIKETDIVKEMPGVRIKSWATSYTEGEKMQRVDLLAEGVEWKILDEVRPPIYISEWYACRHDCACYYELEVKLMNAQNEVLDRFTFNDELPQWTRGQWQKIDHVFARYPAGVRYITFRHLGVDRQFWAGYFGSKFTMSTVKFKFD